MTAEFFIKDGRVLPNDREIFTTDRNIFDLAISQILTKMNDNPMTQRQPVRHKENKMSATKDNA
eukprot:2931528-Amphidinium_carterae.1